MNSFSKEILGLLPERLQKKIKELPEEVMQNIVEIRLRVGKPTVLNLKDESLITNDVSETITAREISAIFSKMCNFSVYSYQNQIKNGFLTLEGGHRVGICGTAVFENGKIANVKDISSINIRFARQISTFNIDICSTIGLNFTGILVVGAPGTGKTTLLRSLAKNYSTMNMGKLVQVCVVDETAELSGTRHGVSQFDLGYADILNGYAKNDGITHAIRAFSPDIIICDEIFENSVNAIKFGANSGAKFIASVHAQTPEDLLHKPFMSELLKINAFDKFVFLADKTSPSVITKILSFAELNFKEQLIC